MTEADREGLRVDLQDFLRELVRNLVMTDFRRSSSDTISNLSRSVAALWPIAFPEEKVDLRK